jgi:hypothetical protein
MTCMRTIAVLLAAVACASFTSASHAGTCGSTSCTDVIVKRIDVYGTTDSQGHWITAVSIGIDTAPGGGCNFGQWEGAWWLDLLNSVAVQAQYAALLSAQARAAKVSLYLDSCLVTELDIG